MGYQTACQVDTQPPAHLTFGIGPDMASDLSLFGASVVTTVPVDKADFNGTDPWVMVSGFSIKIDGGVNGHTHLEDACVGQSFIRSYATLTASTDTSNVCSVPILLKNSSAPPRPSTVCAKMASGALHLVGRWS